MKKHRVTLGTLLAIAIALLAACGSSGTPSNASLATPTAASADAAVGVTLLDKKIEASRTTFRVGSPYNFTITNKGKAPHAFIISMRVQGPAPAGSPDKILYIINTISPGATKNGRYVFPLSAPESDIRLATQLAGPDGPGIFIPIQVKT